MRFRLAAGTVAAVLAAASMSPVGCGDNPSATQPQRSPLDLCMARAVFGNPATSEYILPCPVGASFSLLQTYCGPLSHARDNQLAYDFSLPIGAEIVAARAGIVRWVRETYADNDTLGSHTNGIFIQHGDGTTAMYAHLMQRSVVVEEGDRVEQGELIAISGSSGTTIAHLHFGVYRTWPHREGKDVPVSFRNAEGALDERGGLQLGVSYTALPYRS